MILYWALTTVTRLNSKGDDMAFLSWLGEQPKGIATFLGALTGSSLGLLAIIVGALFNAHLNRRRDDRIREHDARAVATALYAELTGIHRALRSASENLRSAPKDGERFLVRTPLVVQIFPELIDKLGLLPAETIREVTHTYLLAERYKQDLLLLPRGRQHAAQETPYGVLMPLDRSASVIELNESTMATTSKALQMLEPYL
ncbi:hypothetical protein [Bradyrhizobium japonicum]|uniref:hypothetical protein n=1 Tax=Bradyrhizobium japonicum TaxID=375 RepID=UPI0020108A61|nr:hypothetical protein [Bradyrhizobium japonicum]UQD99359.1 hypothetical protein JEY30_03450 [Bradyrhizobium japonicum]WLB19352.1 hypothetical protein QIH95_46880 [Bradyrhizobium japonicum]